MVKEITFFETETWFGMVGGAKIGRHGLANGEYVFAISDTGEVEKQVGKVVDANLKNVVIPFVKKTKKKPLPHKYLRPTYIVPPHASTTYTVTKLTPSGAQIEPLKKRYVETKIKRLYNLIKPLPSGGKRWLTQAYRCFLNTTTTKGKLILIFCIVYYRWGVYSPTPGCART